MDGSDMVQSPCLLSDLVVGVLWYSVYTTSWPLQATQYYVEGLRPLD